MSLKYLTNLNLTLNELQNAVLQKVADYTAITNTKKGHIVYDTTLNKGFLNVTGGSGSSAWVEITDVAKDGTLTLAVGSAAASGTAIEIGTGTGFSANSDSNSTYEIKVGPALTAFASAAGNGTNGLVKKTGVDTFVIDTNTYLTEETDTLQDVTGRGASTSNAVTFSGGLTSSGETTVGGTGIVYNGSSSGSTTVKASANAGNNTVTIPSASGTMALTSDISDGSLSVSIGSPAASGTALQWGTSNGFSANASGSSDYDLQVGPSLSALASFMNSGVSGLIKRTGVDTFDIDTNTYLTEETDTLESITARGASTSTAVTFNGGISLGNQKITSLADPTDSQDAATKGYVDAVKSGLDIKESVRVISTSNITLSGLQTIDGVSLAAGDRVLVAGQTAGANNGIYVVASGAWSRAEDANSNEKVSAGMFTFVSEGTVHGDSGWVLTTNDTIIVGTTALAFTQFSGAGQISAGDGLSKSGNVLNVVGTADRITVTSDAVDIASTYEGQTSITTVGTISTGTWNGDNIGLAYGGTGASLTANQGGIVYSGSSSLAIVAPGTSGQLLTSGGTGAPTWTTPSDLTVGKASNLVGGSANEIAIQSSSDSTTFVAAPSVSGQVLTYDGSSVAWAAPTVNKFTTNVGNGSGTSFTYSHGLGTVDVTSSLYSVATGELVFADITVTSSQVTVSFGSAPASGEYRLVVIG